MKSILTILFSLFVFASFSQTNNFAPIGARWYYDDYLNDCPNWPNCGYILMESVKDTLVMGKACRLLKETSFTNPVVPDTDYIVYEDMGRVYLFHDGDFHVLFDFNAEPGDTVEVLSSPFNGFYTFDDIEYSQFKYIINTKSSVIVDGVSLVIQNTQPVGGGDYTWSFGYLPIYERIGSLGLFLGTSDVTTLEFGDYLRCYEDAELSYHNPLYYQNCDFVSGITDQPVAKILVYPNPVKQKVQIDLSAYKLNDPWILLLNDLTGKMVYSSNLSTGEINEINMSSLSDGIYFLSIHSDGIQIVSDKLVKQ